MVEKDPEFKKKVKNSFSKAKEHMDSLENQIKELKELILRQQDQIGLLKGNKAENTLDELKRSLLNDQLHEVSSGSDGVKTNKQTNTYQTNIKQTYTIKDLKDKFTVLPKQKLLLYLTIYQFGDESKPATYVNLSKSLKLSEECLRSYVFDIFKHGLSLDKHRVNNKIVVFKVPEEVRSLNLKQFLEDLYYNIDPSQSRLTDV